MSDFSAFEDRKLEDARFNKERKIVWKKMRSLQSCLDPLLKKIGFLLEGKVSQYWLNYTKTRVNGIWLAYTDVEPYYIVCQLNCGIYRDGFFVGIEINWKASSHLSNVLNYIIHNKEEFLSYIRQLNPKYVQVTYGNCELPSDVSSEELDVLIDALKTESDWFSIGELYPKNEGFLRNKKVVSRIPPVFETLLPLYYVFAGRRPVGNKPTEKLLRIGDVKERDLRRIEKALVQETSRLTNEERDELISDIDKRNEAEKGKRAQPTQNRRYKRNPVLSLLLKLKYKDSCQVCGENYRIEKGFFCDTHHLLPLRLGGKDTSDNILVVCPNHHRIFERCKVDIILKGKETLIIKACDQTLNIRL